MSRCEILVQNWEDAEKARESARRACAAAGLDDRATTQLVLAFTRLAEHLLLRPGRVGVLRVDGICAERRLGVEIETRLRCSDWAVDLPPIASLVDELDAGFTADGSIRVWARKWARQSRRASQQAARGGRPVLPA